MLYLKFVNFYFLWYNSIIRKKKTKEKKLLLLLLLQRRAIKVLLKRIGSLIEARKEEKEEAQKWDAIYTIDANGIYKFSLELFRKNHSTTTFSPKMIKMLIETDGERVVFHHLDACYYMIKYPKETVAIYRKDCIYTADDPEMTIDEYYKKFSKEDCNKGE